MIINFLVLVTACPPRTAMVSEGYPYHHQDNLVGDYHTRPLYRGVRSGMPLVEGSNPSWGFFFSSCRLLFFLGLIFCFKSFLGLFLSFLDFFFSFLNLFYLETYYDIVWFKSFFGLFFSGTCFVWFKTFLDFFLSSFSSFQIFELFLPFTFVKIVHVNPSLSCFE